MILPDCPHRSPLSTSKHFRCELAAMVSARFCARCVTQWVDGPPSEDRLTPALQDARPSRGLGDTVAKALHAVGIEQRPGCGCAERQAALNEMWPYGK